MKVFSSVAEAAASKELEGAAICLGNFDGVHLGHRALIAEAGRRAPVAALTFAPHPGKVLQPDLAPRLIASPARKLELLAAAGVRWTVVQPFNAEYARTTAGEFEAQLLSALRVKAVVVGYDFTYGTKRSGTVATLESACARAGAQLAVVPPVTVEGVVVSSSRVREYVLEGRVEAARKLLGRFFDLDGAVVAGAGRGRSIGFPTANIDTANELRPGPGVYAVRVAELGGEGRWGGAANIGVKPTFGGGEITIEAHLLDYSGDLYGRRLRVEFVERLRAEQRFSSVAELVAQIGRDVAVARACLAQAP